MRNEKQAFNTCWDATKGEMIAARQRVRVRGCHRQTDSQLRRAACSCSRTASTSIAQGNVWVADGNDNLPRRGRGAAPDAPLPPRAGKVVGHQVVKFSPEGKVLLTLGKAGGNPANEVTDPASFYQPNDVITLPNGDILVAEGHNNGTMSHRIARFDRGRQVSELVRQARQR